MWIIKINDNKNNNKDLLALKFLFSEKYRYPKIIYTVYKNICKNIHICINVFIRTENAKTNQTLQ